MITETRKPNNVFVLIDDVKVALELRMGNDCFHRVFGLSSERTTGMIQNSKVGFSAVELIEYGQIIGYVEAGEPKGKFIRLGMDLIHEGFACAL